MMSRMAALLVLLSAASLASAADTIEVVIDAAKERCLSPGDAIEVSFSKDADENFADNWIAIYRADRVDGSTTTLEGGELWTWLCGTQVCSQSTNPPAGTITFDEADEKNWLQNWPLRKGAYRAVLSKGLDGEDWPALAISDVFEVGCDPVVKVDEICYEPGDNIDIDFSKLPEGQLFVGLYDQSSLTDLPNLPDNVDEWSWTCGGMVLCADFPSSGELNLTAPVEEGDYVAVAARFEADTPFTAEAQSPSFRVRQDCSVPIRADPEMLDTISAARRDIERLIEGNVFLPGKFLRLAFHDCVGGCDGCVDMTNPDNAGLIMPIDELEPVVDEYREQGLSRTDIWMLSAAVASEVVDTQRGIGFPFQWIGRRTCEELNDNDCGRGADGNPSPCGPFAGPHRALCHADTAGTRTIQKFMTDEFGFDDQQTTAIMGAHTIGAMRDVNLGFEGRSGYVDHRICMSNSATFFN